MILYGLYWVVRALFVQVDVGGDQQYTGPLLFWDAGQILVYIFYGIPLLGNPSLGGYFNGFVLPGPLIYVGIGLFLLALSTLRPRLAYWSLQVTLWLVSMSLWFALAFAPSNQNGIDIPDSFAPFFWITLVCSLLLLIVYKPVLALLRRFCIQPRAINSSEEHILSVVQTKE